MPQAHNYQQLPATTSNYQQLPATMSEYEYDAFVPRLHLESPRVHVETPPVVVVPPAEPTMVDLEMLTKEVILMLRYQKNRVNIPRCMEVLKRIKAIALEKDPGWNPTSRVHYYMVDVSDLKMTRADEAWLDKQSKRFQLNADGTLRVLVDN